jgi:hypothetical protein
LVAQRLLEIFVSVTNEFASNSIDLEAASLAIAWFRFSKGHRTTGKSLPPYLSPLLEFANLSSVQSTLPSIGKYSTNDLAGSHSLLPQFGAQEGDAEIMSTDNARTQRHAGAEKKAS